MLDSGVPETYLVRFLFLFFDSLSSPTLKGCGRGGRQASSPLGLASLLASSELGIAGSSTEVGDVVVRGRVTGRWPMMNH